MSDLVTCDMCDGQGDFCGVCTKIADNCDCENYDATSTECPQCGGSGTIEEDRDEDSEDSEDGE